jgi:environmental stress-induced protein Ves
MRVVRFADWRQMPWKNGGGVTAEIAVSPAGAGMDDFDWRISAAQVDRAGPFSRFPGVARTLFMLRGQGMVLKGPEFGSVVLTTDSPAFAFSADSPVDAELVDGPILDLNIMSRRSRTRHVATRLAIEGRRTIPAAGAVTLIHSLSSVVAVQVGGESTVLGRNDTAIIEMAGHAIDVVVDEPSEVVVTTVEFVD